MSDTDKRAIERAIDGWVLGRGEAVRRDDHASLAESIHGAIESNLRGRVASKALLVDVDAQGEYINPRLVEFEGAEETLYPIDPKTDEPVGEPVAHYVLTLPRPEDIAEV